MILLSRKAKSLQSNERYKQVLEPNEYIPSMTDHRLPTFTHLLEIIRQRVIEHLGSRVEKASAVLW